jgi:hypothetical protein
MRRAVSAGVVALALGVGACSGGDDPGDPDAAVAGGDAAVGEKADAALPAACEAPAPIGVVPPFTEGEAVIDLGDDDTHLRIDYNGRMDANLLRFALIEGYGAFTEGFAAGTYAIEGDDADSELCGLCTLLITRFVEPDRSQFLIARSGTITIDRIDETADGRLVGSASDLALTRLIYDGEQERWVLAEDCTTAIDQATFDVPLTPGPFFP